MINLINFFSQTALFVYALIIFLILAVICFLLFYKNIKEDSTVLIKASKKEKRDLIDFSEGLGADALNQKNKKEGQRFSDLIVFDEQNLNAPPESFDEVSSLKKFSEDFRNFCATYAEDKKLYYTESDIRSFISNLATSHIMILQGMSGTGKTSIATAFQKFIENTKGVDVIPIQPMWKERSDLLGYYNEFTKKFNETQLLKELYLATYSDKMFIIVLDEMNIARVEYYFAEFLSMLELNVADRKIEITNDHWDKDPAHIIDGKLKVLENVYFLGTANNDESTFSISDKVYDRAMVINLDKRAEPFNGVKVAPCKISNTNFMKLTKNAVETYSNTEYEIVDGWVNDINVLLNQYFGVNFGNRMVVQIKQFVPVYVACGGTKEEAFDDFVSKKILRKLEAKDPYRVNNSLEDFIKDLDIKFGRENLKLCREVLSKYRIGR